MAIWQIHKAKQKLSQVIRLARIEGPQQITHRGKPSAWIVSDEDYLKLKKNKKKQESIIDVFQRSPHRNLSIPIERKKDSLSLYSLSKDLCGAVNGPKDLSENSAYLEGYGQ